MGMGMGMGGISLFSGVTNFIPLIISKIIATLLSVYPKELNLQNI